MKRLIKPIILKPGDTVATITLSSALASRFPWRYESGKKQLEETFGVNIIETPNSFLTPEELHKNPKLRADDLMWAFQNPDVKAIISNIGGEDSIRLYPFVNFDIIKNNPKIVMGYSDTTSVHLMCYHAGISSIYGPSIMSGFAENKGIPSYLKNSVQKTLFCDEIIGEIKPNQDGWMIEELNWANPENQHIKRKCLNNEGYFVIQGEGIVEGHLLGGCMEVLDMCRGTDLFPTPTQWKNAILFMETSEEYPPVGMMRNFLQSMAASGSLQGLKGIIMGRPKEATYEGRHQYDNVIRDILKCAGRSDMPVLSQMDFGHTEPHFCIPYGAKARIDITQKRFEILDSAVRQRD